MIAHSTLTGIIDQYPGATGVLDRYEIDYSGNGNCTLSELFEGNAMRLFEVVREIYTVSEQVEKTMPGSGPSDLTIGDLCNYIIEEYHSYVKSVLPAMLVHGYQVAQAFGSIYAELDQIKKHLTMIRAEFNQHMMMEEEVLFPGAILLEQAVLHNIETGTKIKKIIDPLKVIMKEHSHAEKWFAELRKLSNGYTCPEDADNLFRLFYKELKEFEADLRVHVHLENEVLFPRIKKLIIQTGI